jgi:NAD(P)-dependent dehydrogenase (short-subunit alcohol dehydrogenase family)
VAEFDGKTVVITGAGRGIGRRLAVDFAAAGARVVVNYAASAAGARDAVEEIAAGGGEALACQADIADAAAVAAMFDAALEAFGSIDVLINNAGLNIDKPFLELAEDDWDRVCDVNLKGPFLCCQAAGRAMVAAGRGRIVNISAVTSIDARRNAANYCSSKAGLNMLTKCLALELAPHVAVNCLALGFIESAIVREPHTDDQLAAVVGETPLGRMGSYDDVWGAVRYLASDTASFITGQTMILDGGRIMR